MRRRSLLISIACVLVSVVASFAAIPELGFAKEEALERRLGCLVIPKAEFKETPFREALDFVVAEGRRLDPQFRNIKITMKLDGSADEIVIQDGSGQKTSAASEPRTGPVADGQVTVHSTNEPFLSLLGSVTGLAKLTYRMEADGIHIVPKDDLDPMFTRDFRIPIDLYPTLDEEDRRNRAEMLAQFKKDPRQFLMSEGIEFQQGAGAILADDFSRLTVHNSRSELYQIWWLLRPRAEDFSLKLGRDLARTAQMRKRMKATVLPRVDLQNVRLDEALKALEKADARRDPAASKGNPIRIKIRQREHPISAVFSTDIYAGYDPPYVAGLDPEPKPVTTQIYPGVAVLPEVTLVASQIPFIDALGMIADRAEYMMFTTPDGAVLVPIETVDVQYFRLPIPPRSYAKLEPVLTHFRDGKPVTKSWLRPAHRPGEVSYVQQSRMVHFGGSVGTEAVVQAIENAWVEFFSAEMVNQRKAK
jgi:hypothetical protein